MHVLTCLMLSSGSTKTDCTLSKKICILEPWHTPHARSGLPYDALMQRLATEEQCVLQSQLIDMCNRAVLA